MTTSIPKAENLLRMPMAGNVSGSYLLDIEQYCNVWVQIEWVADAASAAGDTIGLAFKIDPNSLLAYPIPFTKAATDGAYNPRVIGLGSTGAAAPVTVTASAFAPGVGAGNFFALFEDPPPFLQVNVTRSAGVVAGRYLLSVFGRGG